MISCSKVGLQVVCQDDKLFKSWASSGAYRYADFFTVDGEAVVTSTGLGLKILGGRYFSSHTGEKIDSLVSLYNYGWLQIGAVEYDARPPPLVQSKIG
jgi:hypothetical protein